MLSRKVDEPRIAALMPTKSYAPHHLRISVRRIGK
jgi:hypothetical protein